MLHYDCVKYIVDPPKPDLLISSNIKFNGKNFALKRNQVHEYLNDYFFYYYDMYVKIKKLGLPNGNGWANEPLHVIDAYLILDREQNAIEAEQMDNRE